MATTIGIMGVSSGSAVEQFAQPAVPAESLHAAALAVLRNNLASASSVAGLRAASGGGPTWCVDAIDNLVGCGGAHSAGAHISLTA